MATYFQTLYDVCSITERYAGYTGLLLEDYLSLQSEFDFEAGSLLSDYLTLTNTFLTSGDGSRVLKDTLVAKSIFAPGINKLEYIGRQIPNFAPEIKNTNLATGGIPIVVGPPTEGIGEGIPGPIITTTVVYPNQSVSFVCGQLSITLNAPEFNNKDLFDEKRININTRGLTLILYRDPLWPDSTTYDVNFKDLSDLDIAFLQAFLRATIGLPIAYVDIYGITHLGFITDPEAQAVSSATGYSIRFTFLEALPA